MRKLKWKPLDYLTSWKSLCPHICLDVFWNVWHRDISKDLASCSTPSPLLNHEFSLGQYSLDPLKLISGKAALDINGDLILGKE